MLATSEAELSGEVCSFGVLLWLLQRCFLYARTCLLPTSGICFIQHVYITKGSELFYSEKRKSGIKLHKEVCTYFHKVCPVHECNVAVYHFGVLSFSCGWRERQLYFGQLQC